MPLREKRTFDAVFHLSFELGVPHAAKGFERKPKVRGNHMQRYTRKYAGIGLYKLIVFFFGCSTDGAKYAITAQSNVA